MIIISRMRRAGQTCPSFFSQWAGCAARTSPSLELAGGGVIELSWIAGAESRSW
jgi:hypothetical protein